MYIRFPLWSTRKTSSSSVLQGFYICQKILTFEILSNFSYFLPSLIVLPNLIFIQIFILSPADEIVIPDVKKSTAQKPSKVFIWHQVSLNSNFFPSFVQICQIEKEENQRNAVERTNMNMKSAKKEENSQLEYFRKFKVTVLASLDISSSKFFEEKLKRRNEKNSVIMQIMQIICRCKIPKKINKSSFVPLSVFVTKFVFLWNVN